MSNILMFLEELEMYYFEKYDLYSASYIEALIKDLYLRSGGNG